MQTARKNAGARAAALDAGVHDRPDVEELAAYFLLCTEGHLIGHCDFGDAHPIVRALLEKFLAGLERVRDRCRVAHDGGVLVLSVLNDKTAADGVESALDHDFLARPGGERHAVGMKREGPVAVKDKVGRDVKGNLPTAMDSIQSDTAIIGDRRGSSRSLIRVDGGRIFAFQTQQDGGLRPVSVPGRSQRAEELRTHAGDLRPYR